MSTFYSDMYMYNFFYDYTNNLRYWRNWYIKIQKFVLEPNYNIGKQILEGAVYIVQYPLPDDYYKTQLSRRMLWKCRYPYENWYNERRMRLASSDRSENASEMHTHEVVEQMLNRGRECALLYYLLSWFGFEVNFFLNWVILDQFFHGHFSRFWFLEIKTCYCSHFCRIEL